jgi:uncharacterized membrane protein YoaK (UPF0700 family)
LTLVTGLVDAFSYLRLGHVFVANMTGNVVFLGFGLAGVGEISIVASLLALLAFALGATLGRRWAGRRAMYRGHLLAAATSVQPGVVFGRRPSSQQPPVLEVQGYEAPDTYRHYQPLPPTCAERWL